MIYLASIGIFLFAAWTITGLLNTYLFLGFPGNGLEISGDGFTLHLLNRYDSGIMIELFLLPSLWCVRLSRWYWWQIGPLGFWWGL